MDNEVPKVLVTRKMPEAVNRKLKAHFTVSLNETDQLFSDSELESGTDQGTGRSGTEVSQTDDSEDSNMSDSGAGFLGGIGSFDAFLNNVQSHVTPGFAGKRKGAGRGPDDRTAKAGGAGAVRGAAGGSKELKTKQRLILVYWLSQLGKASDPDGSCARACMSRCRVCFLCL